MANSQLQSTSEKLVNILLNDFGGDATYSVVIAESTNQDTGVTIPSTSTPYPINTYQRNGTLEEISSNQVTSTQSVFLIESKSLPQKPSSDDLIEMNGETLKFSKILKSVSGGQSSVLYYVVAGI